MFSEPGCAVDALGTEVRVLRLLPIGVAVFLSGTHALAQVSFHGIGIPPGLKWSEAWDISDDGQTVCGWGSDGSDGQGVGYRWRSGTGFEILTPLSNFPAARGTFMSADGSVVVGMNWDTDISLSRRGAARWDTKGNVIPIAPSPPPGEGGGSVPGGVSDDGMTAVGSWDRQAFRWTEAKGTEVLPVLADTHIAYGQAISRNGKVMAGRLQGLIGSGYGVVWNGDEMPTALALPPGGTFANPSALSGDGSVVTGSVNIGSKTFAARWVSGAVSVLDQFPDTDSVGALALSGDGMLVGGWMQTPGTGARAVLWDGQGHVRRVDEILTAAGVDLTGWYLSEVTGMSADGTRLVGNGFFVDDANVLYAQGWVAEIPAPGVAGLLGEAGLLGAGRRRGRA